MRVRKDVVNRELITVIKTAVFRLWHQ